MFDLEPPAPCKRREEMVGPSLARPRISRSSPTAEWCQSEIIKAGGLSPLLRLLQATDHRMIPVVARLISPIYESLPDRH